MKKLNADDFRSGDIVAEMHCHTTDNVSAMPAYGWHMRDSTVEIHDVIFYAMKAKFERGQGDLTMNKYAYLVAATEDDHGDIEKMVVIYRYDHSYYIATLFRP